MTQSLDIPSHTKRQQKLRRRLFLLIPCAVAIIAVYLLFFAGRYVSTDNAYIKADVVNISAEISGQIVNVLVDENQSVKTGDLLLIIDARPYLVAQQDAEARLDQAYIEINALKALYIQKDAALAAAQDDLTFATKQQHRIAGLYKRGSASAAMLDQAQRDLDVARNTVEELTSERNETLAKLSGSPDVDADKHPAVLAAKAALNQARLNIERCSLRAPFDGIASKIPNIGSYSMPGLPLISVVANRNTWIEANFKEDQLAQLTPGDTVDIEIDAYPGEHWSGRVHSIAQATNAEFSLLPAQNATGNWVKIVQRVPVRLAIEHHDGESPLRAGLSSTVRVNTGLPHRLKRLYQLLGVQESEPRHSQATASTNLL